MSRRGRRLELFKINPYPNQDLGYQQTGGAPNRSNRERRFELYKAVVGSRIKFFKIDNIHRFKHADLTENQNDNN